MKILVVCQYYYPETVRITDICEELVKRGHEVKVITDIPNYPMGEIYEGYGLLKNRNQTINGVRVHRSFTIPRKSGPIFRVLNYYSFAFFSTIYAVFMKADFDVVFVNQLSPVMMAYAAIIYAKKHNKKLVMYCLDLWPESLVAGGITRGSLVYKLFHKFSKDIYKQFDKILVTSKSFSNYFEKEFSLTNTEYLPQYAEELFTPGFCRKEPDEYFDLMFAGNIGAMQSIDTIIKAAELLKNKKNIRWHIVGDGSELGNLKEQAKNLDNVFFYGRKSIEEMPKYYSMADAMLVTMKKDPIISLTLPGKIQSYMLAGKLILGAADGEIKNTINESKCGLCCDAEDYVGLAKLVVELSQNGETEKYAKNSFDYYEENFLKSHFIDFLIEELTK